MQELLTQDPYYDDLISLHKTIINMDMSDEIMEQYLIFKYLDRSSTGVLEFGGNIGRSSIVINKLLKNPKNHIVFEPDINSAKILEQNKNNNHCHFIIISAALSKYPLVQNVCDVSLGQYTKIDDGNYDPKLWKKITTISYPEFKKKYPIIFDTLVIDCEGCIIPILKDYGDDLLSTIKTIIIENDDDQSQPDFVYNYLLSKNFTSIICHDSGPRMCFYQVFKKKIII